MRGTYKVSSPFAIRSQSATCSQTSPLLTATSKASLTDTTCSPRRTILHRRYHDKCHNLTSLLLFAVNKDFIHYSTLGLSPESSLFCPTPPSPAGTLPLRQLSVSGHFFLIPFPSPISVHRRRRFVHFSDLGISQAYRWKSPTAPQMPSFAFVSSQIVTSRRLVSALSLTFRNLKF